MTARSLTAWSPNGRVYLKPGENGRSFPGVTTVIGTLDKSKFLTPWAARLAAECAVNERDAVAAILGEKPSPQSEAAAVAFIKEASKRYTTHAAETGTAVHEAIEEAILNDGQLRDEYPKRIAGHMKQFAAWQLEHPELEYLATELTVFGDTGGGYAGSLDAIARLDLGDGNGIQTVLLDVKTSKSVHSEVALQLTAYRRADTVVLRTGKTMPMPATDAAAVVHVRPRSHHLVVVRSSDAEWVAFRALLAAWRWRTEHSENVLSQQVLAEAAGLDGASNDDLLARLMDGAK